MKAPELKTGQMITIVYILAILIALYIVYKILAATGLIKTKARKKQEETEQEATVQLRSMDWFNPMILKDRPSDYVTLGLQGKEYAARLRNAIRGFGTNEEMIFSIFGSLRRKWNVAEVALNYKAQYNRDLKADLLDDLNDKEGVILYELIKKLPE